MHGAKVKKKIVVEVKVDFLAFRNLLHAYNRYSNIKNFIIFDFIFWTCLQIAKSDH
jgi:hypothetical protein